MICLDELTVGYSKNKQMAFKNEVRSERKLIVTLVDTCHSSFNFEILCACGANPPTCDVKHTLNYY